MEVTNSDFPGIQASAGLALTPSIEHSRRFYTLVGDLVVDSPFTFDQYVSGENNTGYWYPTQPRSWEF